jgi:hypothetical protein
VVQIGPGLIVCKQVSLSRSYLNHLVFKECGDDGVRGESPGQCTLHDSVTATCSKTLITYITATVSAADVQNSTAIIS